MTITTAVDVPVMTDSGSETDADAFAKWLCCVSQEVAAAFGGYGLLSGRSDTSLTVATGTKIWVLKEDSAFAKGMYVKATNARDSSVTMSGVVTDYVSGTKTLTVSVQQATSIGDTVALWILQATARPSIGQFTQAEITLEGGNGSGSTNNKIRRFTTAVVNTGAAMTYADSATDGGSITINETGWYVFGASDGHASGNYEYGITKNTVEPTVAFGSLADKSEILCIGNIVGGAQYPTTGMALLTVGDILRHHGNGNTGAAANEVYMFCRRVA